MDIFYSARKLLVGLRLRCPNCEQGHMFSGLFKMEEKCSICGARFERAPGESVGGMVINLSVAEVLTMSGIIISQALHVPLAIELTVWIAFNALFIVLFYRHARGMWVSINFLTGGVYPDKDEPVP